MSKRIVIIGGGESGAGAALLASQKGFDVFLSDAGNLKEKYRKLLAEHNIAYESGRHTESLILNADEVIKSPGVPYKAEIIQKIKATGIPVISEIEFAGRYTAAKIIGITGTNGKTTTTLLTHHIFRKAGLNVRVAGNVGNSFAMEVANAETDCDYYVLELSSFQLDGIYDFRIHTAILTNITPDHLDRYEYELQNYVDSKFRIAVAQTANDHFIYCSDDELTMREISRKELKAELLPFSILTHHNQIAYTDNDRLIINYKNTTTDMFLNDLALQGKHNLYNSMAAAIAAKVMDVSNDVIREALTDFENIEHRLEFVNKVKGVEFVNDSKATNVNSTWYALECQYKPVIWIVGGVDKGNDYAALKDLAKEKVKAIICLGKDNKKIIKEFKGVVDTIVEASSMAEAVKAGYYMGKKGDVVLLSPACASFDLFENYEDRGHQFKQYVREL